MSKRLVILGGGESGVGAAILAKKKGFEVFVSDKGEIKDRYKNVLKFMNDNVYELLSIRFKLVFLSTKCL